MTEFTTNLVRCDGLPPAKRLRAGYKPGTALRQSRLGTLRMRLSDAPFLFGNLWTFRLPVRMAGIYNGQNTTRIARWFRLTRTRSSRTLP